MDEITKSEKLKKELFNEKQNGWERVGEKEKELIFKFSDEYIYFLNRCKTEREVISFTREILEKNNFKNLENVESIENGDRIFYVNRDKSMYIAVIGEDKLSNGLNIIGAHVDSPRLDLKPNPMYEQDGFALLKTHYYGGIKKYQWATIPLALHGVFVKTNGEKITVNIGEDEQDPVFTITDLLPHLARRTS